MKKISNPPNPFDARYKEWLEPAPAAHLEVYEDASRTILSHNDSPDLSFRWTVNPYRGCFHACAYCYARQYHEYLGLGAGTDFESKITIKPNAPALLDGEFRKRSWKGELVVFSGATDCYQPLEAVYRLTRGCLEVCSAFRNPAAVITKAYLVVRDIDVFQELHRNASFSAVLSIPFATNDAGKKIEPQASLIERRFEAVTKLAKAGLSVGVSLAPTIPGLNDADIPMILKRAKECGATFAFHSMVRLPGSVESVFMERAKENLAPERVEKIVHRIKEGRSGKMTDERMSTRRQGTGNYWQSIEDLFRVSVEKYGYKTFSTTPKSECSTFRVPTPQLALPFTDDDR